MTDSTASVRYEIRDHVARVTLNRPERLNALDLAGWEQLGEVMGTVNGDASLRCVVITGAGDAFGAGADIAAFGTERKDQESAMRYGEIEMRGVLAVAHCPHPTVARIRGACVGGGLEIALGCDLRIAAASSRFGIPINRLGLTLSYEEADLFRRAVSREAAMELLLEGKVVDADRALALGLVGRVVPDRKLDEEVDATVERIVAGAPLVNRWHKRFFHRLEDPRPLTEEERAEGYAAFATEDFRIGYRAFLDKEPPEFTGR